jgi:hypothetical protein
VLRAAYRQETASGNHPEFALTVTRFATPDNVMAHSALNAIALSGSDGFTVADFLEFNYGGELQAIQFRGRVNAFRPFGSVGAHLSKVERGAHHEVALSQREGKNSFQVAYFIDRMHRAALNGVGDLDTDFYSNMGSGNFLPDLYSGTFSYNGGDYDAQGIRLVAERKRSEALTAAID